MRFLVAGIAALSFFSLPAFAQHAEYIVAQNAPIQSAPEPSNIVTKASKGPVSPSYLIKDAPLKTDYVMGKKDAPVVLVEYASMSCPHCAHFSNTVLPVIEQNYIKTGKVAYVLRQFPLNEPALRAAMLLDCVGTNSPEQYYTFARVLFDAQNNWAFDTNFLSSMEIIAGVGGISKQQFKACTADKDREIKVLEAKKLTNDELKIPHTPLIFIDGEMYEGPKTPEDVSRFIDVKLAKKGK